MRGTIQKNDYIGFTYNGIHTSQFGLYSSANGDRYQRYLSPQFSDISSSIAGRDGAVYFGTNMSTKTFTFNLVFDSMTEEEYFGMKKWLNGGIGDLVLDENPYIKYRAKPSQVVQVSFLVFLDDYDARVYKGEFQVSFVCYEGYGRSLSKYIESYSSTGFLDTQVISAANMSNSISEWALASHLLPQQVYHDITYDTYVDGKFYLYNPGDVPTDFEISIPDNYSTIELVLCPWDTATEAVSTTFTGYFQLTNLPCTGGTLHIDTYRRLVYVEDANGNKTPYNDCWNSGDFFKIPCNEELDQYSVLQITAGSDTPTGEITIDYDYKYL